VRVAGGSSTSSAPRARFERTRAGGHTVRAIGTLMGISRATLYACIKEFADARQEGHSRCSPAGAVPAPRVAASGSGPADDCKPLHLWLLHLYWWLHCAPAPSGSKPSLPGWKSRPRGHIGCADLSVIGQCCEFPMVTSVGTLLIPIAFVASGDMPRRTAGYDTLRRRTSRRTTYRPIRRAQCTLRPSNRGYSVCTAPGRSNNSNSGGMEHAAPSQPIWYPAGGYHEFALMQSWKTTCLCRPISIRCFQDWLSAKASR